MPCFLIGREAAGREVSSSAGVIDNQSVKTTESGGPRGYDADKSAGDGPSGGRLQSRAKGRKRHISPTLKAISFMP